MAPRGAEGAAAVAEAWQAVACGWLLRTAAAGARQPRLGLRLRRGPDAGGSEVPDAMRGGRVHARGAGDPCGAEAVLIGRHRRAGRPVRRAQGTGAHSL
jgi:hypothetical protein